MPWIGPGPGTREGGLLGSGLHHLEHPNGVATAQHVVDTGIVERDMIHIRIRSPILFDQADRFVNEGEHAQAKEIDLDQADVADIVLVPLGHHAPRHGGPLQRQDVVQRCGGDDHPAHVDAQVPGETGYLPAHLQELRPGLRPQAVLELRQFGQAFLQARCGIRVQ